MTKAAQNAIILYSHSPGDYQTLPLFPTHSVSWSVLKQIQLKIHLKYPKTDKIPKSITTPKIQAVNSSRTLPYVIRLLAETPNSVHRCFRQGVVAARLTMEPLGSVASASKRYPLWGTHSWRQPLPAFLKRTENDVVRLQSLPSYQLSSSTPHQQLTSNLAIATYTHQSTRHRIPRRLEI